MVPVALLADGMPPEANQSANAPAPRVAQGDLQADAPDQYTVVKGDTLWGIAGRFLKDPWKWPQIWQMNRDQIKNPHWIYPGDIVKLDRNAAGGPRLSLETGGGADVAAANVVKLEPKVRVETLRTAVASIPGTAIGPFLNQPLVVDAGGLDNAPAIVATEESRVVVGEGDTAYADRMGSRDGVNWQVYRRGNPMVDPETGEVLGYEARYIGDARVRRFGNPSALQITKARQEINRGDRLMPARETTFPSYVPRAPDKMLRGVIMGVDGGVSELGQFQIVSINRGARDGIEVGHVLATYRRGADLSSNGHEIGGPSEWLGGSWLGGWMHRVDTKPNPVVPDAPRLTPSDEKAGVALEGQSFRLPDERTGLVFVFRVFEKMSYALVMRSTRPLYVGDAVQTP